MTITRQEAMTLSGLCYVPTSPGTGIPKHLANPTLATRGEWKVAWGPVERLGNLVFVAHHAARNVYAVAIRGTRPIPGAAFLLNLYEDLDVGHTVPWTPSTVPGAAVARGTFAGLANLLAMKSKNATLEQFIRARVLPAKAKLVVTGHSLGGCLASVLAPFLHHRLGASAIGVEIECVTFAAPTAGNAAFGAYFRTVFPGADRCFNSIDFVPMAWQTLDAVGKLFPKPGPPCSPLMRGALQTVAKLLKKAGLTYEQPLPGTALPGRSEGRAFEIEAFMQHDPNTYLKLLGAPVLPFSAIGIQLKGIHLPKLSVPSGADLDSIFTPG